MANVLTKREEHRYYCAYTSPFNSRGDVRVCSHGKIQEASFNNWYAIWNPFRRRRAKKLLREENRGSNENRLT